MRRNSLIKKVSSLLLAVMILLQGTSILQLMPAKVYAEEDAVISLNAEDEEMFSEPLALQGESKTNDADPAVPAQEGGDCSDSDDANIGNYYVYWEFKWLNGNDGVSLNYEYKDPETGEADRTYLFFHPQSESKQSAILGVTVSFTGPQDEAIPANAVEIRIPASVFSGWDGIKADKIITMIPQAPATNSDTYYNWYLDEETKEIVIKNWHEIVGEDYFHEEFSYQVDPLDVPGGYPDEDAARAAGFTDPVYNVGAVAGSKDIDRYCWNHGGEYLWKDYYVNKDINSTITIDPDLDGEPDYFDLRNNLSLAMMTRAFGFLETKPQPDAKNGVYTVWQSTWGARPDDASKYVYVVWNVANARPAGLQADQPWRTDVYFDADYPAITFGEGDDQVVVYGQQVGQMKHTWPVYGAPSYSGRSNWSTLSVWGGDSSQGYYTNIANNTTNTTDRNNYYTFARSSHANTYRSNTSSYVTQWTTSSTSNDGWNTVHYAVLVKYPIDVILENAEKYGINLETDGIKIYARYTADEKWESSYEIERAAVGVAELFVWEREGGGVFDKIAGPHGRTEGAQSALELGYPVTLAFNNFDGSVRYPYRMNYDGTSLSGTLEDGTPVLYGQKVVITERQLMLSSANATHPQGWFPEDDPDADDYYGNTILNDDDYTIPFFDVLTFKDYKGEFAAGVWTDSGLVPWREIKPLYIYIRYAHTDEYIPYCAVKYSSTTGWSGYLVKTDGNGAPVIGDDGHPVLETKTMGTVQLHYMLPDGVTGIRYEHEAGNGVLRTVIGVTLGVTLKPTEHVMSVVGRDLENKVNTYVKNIADCDVYKGLPDGSGFEETEWLDLDNYANGTTPANEEIWTLTGSSNVLNVTKDYYTPSGTDPVQIEATDKAKEISYIRLMARNDSGISVNITRGSDIDDRFKLIKGTFFELLPKGTNPQEGSFIGVYNQTWSSHQTGPSAYPNILRYKDTGRNIEYDGTRYFLSADEYQVSTEYIEELDQYLLRIDYEFEDPKLSDSPDTIWYCHMSFFFVLENSFANIRARGTSTQNYVAFMNGSEDGISRPSSASAIRAGNLNNKEDVAALFRDLTAENSANAGAGKITVTWNTVTALEANFSKTVWVPETLNGVLQPEVYTSEGGRVTVGSRYVYKLQLTNMPTAKADSIVFYDILETGTNEDESFWQGSFESVDTSLISTTPSAVSGSNTTCQPVVYYSTVLTRTMCLEEVDPQLSQGDLFDLENEEIWTSTCPEDKSTVTAIAIDCRKSKNGADFHLGQKATLTAFIHMKAPTELPEPDPFAETVNGAVVYSRPFASTPGDLSETPSEFISKAGLALRDTDVVLVKSSDPETGAPENRRQVRSDGTGTIIYCLTLRNYMPFDCDNIVITDPIPEGLTFTRATVKLNGSASETAAESTHGFSYELADDGRSFTFHIDKQSPTITETDEEGNETVTVDKDTKIYIYTTVDALIDEEGNQIFLRDYDNTATLESASGQEKGEDTETMYHRAETVKLDVEKVWDDGEDQDGIRPVSITVKLYRQAESEEEPVLLAPEEGAVLDESSQWKYTFANLSKYYIYTDEETGEYVVEDIEYSIEEDDIDVPDIFSAGYTPRYDVVKGDDGNYTVTLTNYHKPETIDFDFSKVRETVNVDGSEGRNRPLAGITFTLYSDEECTQVLENPYTEEPWTAVSDENGKVSFERLPFGTYYMMETGLGEYEGVLWENDTVYKVEALDKAEGAEAMVVITAVRGLGFDSDETSDVEDGFRTGIVTKGQTGYIIKNNLVKYDLALVKTDRVDEEPIEGAAFDLYFWLEEEGTPSPEPLPGEIDEPLDPDGKNIVMGENVFKMPSASTIKSKGTKVNASSLVTDEEGKVELGTLLPGTYYLLETDAPIDYYKLPTAARIIIEEGSITVEYNIVEIEGEVFTMNGYTYTMEPDEEQRLGAMINTDLNDQPRYGNLIIIKDLVSFEVSEDATFVFKIEGTMGDKTVYSNVAVLTFSASDPNGSMSAILEHIPAGAKVTVTEVYTGSKYELISDPEETAVIMAKDSVAVGFENNYTTQDIGGHGAANIFDPVEGGWHWERKPSSKVVVPPEEE